MVKLPGLRPLRERRLLTQRQLAERAGVNRNTIAGIERGSEPRPDTIRKLAAALDVDPLELIDWPRAGRPRPPTGDT